MNRRPRFMRGVIVAAILALFASILISSLSPLLGTASVIWLAVPSLALGYLLYLLRSTQARSGRVVTLAAWGLFAILSWWFSPTLRRPSRRQCARTRI